jgi:hypothetical protein
MAAKLVSKWVAHIEAPEEWDLDDVSEAIDVAGVDVVRLETADENDELLLDWEVVKTTWTNEDIERVIVQLDNLVDQREVRS